MAVNENDRVSTRRLKEFWQTAKTWIQNFVSGSIATSEETMSSTMDTKILAAKPDYTKPNINGQIGDGFGYNDMVGNYKNFGSSIAFANIGSFFNAVTTEAPFEGNPAISKQVAYMTSTLYATNKYVAFWKAFFKGFEGKLVGIPLNMVDDPNFPGITNFITNLDNFKSVYIPEENCLLSPIYKYGENTYRTKLSHTSGSYATLTYSINGSEYTTQSGNPSLAWCAGYNNMPFDLGSCDIPNGSVDSAKMANNTVSMAHLQDSVVKRLPFSGITKRNYYKDIDGVRTRVYDPTPVQIEYHQASNSNFNCVLQGFCFEGNKDQLTNNQYLSGTTGISLNPVITLDSTNSKIILPKNFISNGSNIETIPNGGNVSLAGGGTVWVEVPTLCILVVQKNGTSNIYYGRVHQEYNVKDKVEIIIFDPTFFTDFVNDNDYLIVQTLNHNGTKTG